MKLSAIVSRTASKRVRGQGMSEYMIIVGVIAAAALATFGYFGQAVEGQIGQQATVLGGSAGNAVVTNAVSSKAATNSVTQSKAANNLTQYDAGAAAQ